MSSQSHRLLQEALELSGEDRAELAAKLIESLDPTFEEAAAEAWEAEIARRIAELDEGRAKLTPWPEVRQLLVSRHDVKKGR